MEDKKQKTFWVTDNRFKWISVLLLIIFIIFMTFLFVESEAIKHNPCQICAERMGKDVICTIGADSRTFFPNYTIMDKSSGGE